VVECSPDTWLRAGLDKMSEADTCAYLASVFAEPLQGQVLLANKFLRWLNFPIVKNKRWHHGNLVLLGDALHTAHFSIGSGTKLALEDSAALADAFAVNLSVAAALQEFEHKRKRWVDEFQEAALRSLTWLENVGCELGSDPVAFAYRAQTRSKRVGYGRVKRTAPDFAARYDSWKDRQPPASGPVPPEWLDLFCKRSFGHLATLMADGTPHVTPVWVDYDGTHVLINSARGRLKDKHMEARPDVALEIQDPDNPNRYLLVRGPVVSISESGADEQLDAMSPRYLNREKYPAGMRYPGEVRRLYKIKPKSVVFWDPFG
jgi:PPOX class probable F420-dependent enzyme